MTILRVLLDAPPESDRAFEWALYGDDHHLLQTGTGTRDRWPSFGAAEFVLAAHLGRLVTLSLPPLPAARASSAARFALEDQIAGAPEHSHIAVAPQASDGSVRMAVLDNATMQAMLTGVARLGVDSERMLLESDLALAPENGWRWCAAHASAPGFIRTSSGTSIATGAMSDAELLAAITQSGTRKPRVILANVDGFTASMAARAQDVTGVDFTAGAAWKWFEADAATYARAINLQSGAYGDAPRQLRGHLLRQLRPALVLIACALALHLIATIAEWGKLEWQVSAAQRQLASLAQTAVPGVAANASPAIVIAQRDAELRHARGLAARDDFVPLLARAAPAMTGLPAGAIKALRYGEGHVVFDLQQLDSTQTTRVQRDLQRAGLVAVVAPTAAGARLRVGFD
jgi:type II secretion system protein L